MSRIVLLALSLSLMFAGCEYTGPSVRVKSPYPAAYGPAKNGSNFCPPGQAKKGRC